MKFLATLFTVVLTLAGYAQDNLNNYKYVIVPQRYEFSKEDDQYGLNSATKFLLDQKGFVSFIGNKGLPPALVSNKCGALMAEVIEKKGLFTTNLTLLLKDCQGNIVFKSKEGKSREKEFAIAYDEALRNAFSSLNSVPYKYDSSAQAQAVVGAAVPSSSLPASNPSASPAVASVTASTMAAVEVGTITGVLYAQATPNGYQLIDTSPKKVLQLLKTSIPDCYIAQAGSSSGVVIKKDGAWFFESYKDDKLVSQKLEIKF